ncbi:HAUS augmin-like complex subunit 5 [Acipenser ruthenus]|uniref:HAUS augmin-like complex subunit 5 n=1 Tax=Acipenser ruthenus TaxID=7906 RepID=UPI0027427125|nr:HAUS augmin-like complex subunit 5 [Acipenser ruthenus]XP_058866858.1 HAUS augmin-like complex subunit 5 [Acipenser ruthenus]XP_058866859.1 HAUS augmin-like complex subunit 5 [Acipenser ruthenus]
MDGRSLYQDLKSWASEEFQLPERKLPCDSFFRKLCLGQGTDIWKYVTQHVHHQRNVKIMRGNLQWYKVMQEFEVRRGEAQSEAERRKAIQREVLELRSELEQLDSQIEMAQCEFTINENSVRETWERAVESKKRDVLLRSYAERCVRDRQRTSEDIHRIRGHRQTLEQLTRKAEVEVGFGGTPASGGSAGPEPQILREVKQVCQERFQFFQSLLDSELGTATSEARLCREERGAAFQHWLSSVEDLIRSHPPNHMLGALEDLASQRQAVLREKTDGINVSRDVLALRFRYESQHLQDVSEEQELLPSVKWLLQEGWSGVEERGVSLVALLSQERELSALLDTKRKESALVLAGDSQVACLARAVFDLELQLSMVKARRDCLQKQCQDWAETARGKQGAILALQHKWQSIMDFRQLVDKKQEQIRGLIKGNSTAKAELMKVKAEIELFVQDRLQRHQRDVELGAQEMHSAVSTELRQFGGLSLAALSRRNVDGVLRVPAHKLSIHRLDSSAPFESRIFDSTCQSLAFPRYRAPEQLSFHTMALKLDLRRLQHLLELKQSCLHSVHQQEELLPAADLQALLQCVRSEDRELVTNLLPTVQHLSQQSSQCLEYGSEVKAAVTQWWEQPAQLCLPEERRHGLTLQQWIERWSMAAKALQQRQGGWQ